MSPEQVKGTSITSQSDIFSLGIVLYKLITGKRPFSGDSANSVMYQIVNEAPPKVSSLNPDFPIMLDMIVTKCIEKKPEDRYQNAKELANDLRSCLEIFQGASAFSYHPISIGEYIKSLKRFAVPGGISQKFVAIGSIIALVAIFVFDLISRALFAKHCDLNNVA